MNSSVETRYPFLDEAVFGFLAKLDPRWKLRGLRDKYLLRHVVAGAGCRMRSPVAARRCSGRRSTASTWIRRRRSWSSCSARSRCGKTGYFDPEAVTHWRQGVSHSARRAVRSALSVEMGLVGVLATQLVASHVHRRQPGGSAVVAVAASRVRRVTAAHVRPSTQTETENGH